MRFVQQRGRGRVLAAEPTPDTERVPIEPLRPYDVTSLLRQRGQILHGLSHGAVGGPVQAALNEEGPGEVGLRLLIQAQRDVGRADGLSQLGVELGPGREPFDQSRRVVQHLGNRDVAPALGGRDRGQHRPEKGVDLFGLGALRLGAAGLPHRGDDSADQRRDHQGDGDGGRAVAHHEFPRPVPGGRAVREHGEATEKAPNVRPELLDRRVTACRLLPQRDEDDVVDLAGRVAWSLRGVSEKSAPGGLRPTATLGGGGSSSQTCRTISAGESWSTGYGRWPASSW